MEQNFHVNYNRYMLKKSSQLITLNPNRRKEKTMSIPNIRSLFDLSHTKAHPYFEKHEHGYEILGMIPEIIMELGNSLGEDYEQIRPQIFIAKDAVISPFATIGSPRCIYTWLGSHWRRLRDRQQHRDQKRDPF